MKKRIAVSLVAAFALTLSACGDMGSISSIMSNEESQEEATEAGEEKEEEQEEESAAEEAAAICDDVIDTDAFHMTFETVGFYPEYSYEIGGGASMSPFVEEGYQLLVLRGHMENKSTEVIPVNAFYCNINVNDSFDIEDADMNICRNSNRELDPYTDFDYIIFGNVPNKLVDMFEKATFTIGFNDGITQIVREFSNGVSTTTTENQYTLTTDLTTAELSNGAGTTETGADASGDSEAAAAVQAEYWYQDYYVDDFNQPTDQWYVTTEKYFSGTFSNSAVSDADLAVKVMADFEKDVTIFLYEYNRNQVKNSSEYYDDTYSITMRTADGTDHNLTGTLYCGDDRIFIDDAYVDEVLAALEGEENVSFYIVNNERTVENYLFTIIPSNFKTVYEAAVAAQ